jgi:hypothetical protein
MSERIGCFFESDPIEIGEAAKNFDDQLCGSCGHWETCRQIKLGCGGRKNEDLQK